MPKVVFVKKARKDVKGTNIKRGDSYYWWQGYKRPKQYSKTPPKQSQVVGSAFLSSVYAIQEGVDEITAGDGLKDEVQNICSDLNDLKEECEEKVNNMPEGLQQSPSGELLTNRAEALQGMIDELEAIDFDEPEEYGKGKEYKSEEEFWQQKLEEVQAVIYGGD